MLWVDVVAKGAAVFGVISFTYVVAKYGISWVLSQAASAFSVVKADFVALEARVKSLEGLVQPAAPSAISGVISTPASPPTHTS